MNTCRNPLSPPRRSNRAFASTGWVFFGALFLAPVFAQDAAPAASAASTVAVTPAGAAPIETAAAAPVSNETAPIQGVETRRLGPEVVEDPSPFQSTEADRKLAAQVIQALSADTKLRGRIAVTALDGKILLSGKVKSVPMIYRAVETSRKVANVRYVDVDKLDRESFTLNW